MADGHLRICVGAAPVAQRYRHSVDRLYLLCKAFMDTRVRIDAREALYPSIPADGEPERALWELPVDVRSASLWLLAVRATLYTLYWAKDVFFPVFLGLMASYSLTPVLLTVSSAGACRGSWRRPWCSWPLSAVFAGPATGSGLVCPF